MTPSFQKNSQSSKLQDATLHNKIFPQNETGAANKDGPSLIVVMIALLAGAGQAIYPGLFQEDSSEGHFAVGS